MLFWFSTERETPITRLSTFCVAAVLVAIGKAVEEPPLKEFLADQLRREEKEGGVDEERVEARTTFWWDFARILGAFIAVTCLSNAPRTMTFVFLAMVMGVTHSILWSGISFYHCQRPTHSPVTSVLRVFKAAQRRRHLSYPQTPIQFFKNDTSELLLLPHIPFFRWLDKAAIVESPTSSAEEQMRLGRLCTVTQVKEVKRLLKMMPMWTTFVVYSLVEATGSTFFLEHIEAPISFVVFKVFLSFTFSYLYDSIILKKRGRNACFLAFGGVYFYSTKVMVMDSSRWRRATLLRIGAGMASSVLCCGVAWLVEAHRLNSKKGADDRDKTIGWTSNLWLLPQFFLWGLMEGLARKGLDDFTNVQVAKSMASYGSSFNDCVLGIGKFLTVLFVFFRSWFGDTISKSHLDKYYRMLALLGLGNLCYYCFVSFFFYAREEAQGEEEELDATALSQSLLPTRERDKESWVLCRGLRILGHLGSCYVHGWYCCYFFAI
ncbi:hypothetical protein L1049_008876 [Liquidambar formosana]|uniref:Uncharacterized protein n=1 Tax=Liquidambar formosana TaxID=63359 RepID=A0AAP0SA40_LIQFO